MIDQLLGASSVEDLGVMFIRDGEGRALRAFVTAGTVTCDNCGKELEFTSRVAVEFVRSAGSDARLEADRRTVADTLAAHVAAAHPR